MDSRNSNPGLAGIGADLLSKIAKSLENRIDVLRFRAVCLTWRSSVPLPPEQPSPYTHLKLSFPIGPNERLHPKRHGHFLLKESTIYALQPVNKTSVSWNAATTWITKIEYTASGKVVIKDPLLRFPFVNLKNKLPRVLNLLDYRVYEICKCHGLEFVDGGGAPELGFNEWKSTTMIKKIVTSSGLDGIGDGFFIMALHTRGNLAVWRMGDEKWNKISDGCFYDDIAYHNGMFCAIGSSGFMICVNPRTLEHALAPQGPRSGSQFKYLVGSLGDLFRVNVEGLDGHALFIGDDVSFSVSGKDFDGLKSNCVYYCDDCFSGRKDDHPGFVTGIFDLENKKANPLDNMMPCYSKLFWPLPNWIKPNPPHFIGRLARSGGHARGLRMNYSKACC